MFEDFSRNDAFFGTAESISNGVETHIATPEEFGEEIPEPSKVYSDEGEVVYVYADSNTVELSEPVVAATAERAESKDYVYEGVIEYCEDEWVVSFPAFDGAFAGGETVKEACRNAAEVLRLAIAGELGDGRKLPQSLFSNSPQLVFCVEVDSHYIKSTECMTVKQAAESLGVTSSRVSTLLSDGLLDAVVIDGKRMVTIASVNMAKSHLYKDYFHEQNN